MTILSGAAGKQSLRRVVMLAIAVGVILPALVIGPFLAVDSFRRDENARIHAVMQQYGSTLGSALNQPMWLADATSAEALVQAVLANPDVVRIDVDDVALGPFLSKSKPTDAAETLVRQKFPILKDAVTIGTLTVTMTTRHVRAELWAQIAKLCLAIGLQIVLTLAVLFLVFERRLIRPVQDLLAALRRMASGDLEARVPSALHDDELGALASGLDDMRVQLAQTLEKVTALNADLEHRVEERTRDLQAALHHLKTAQTEMERAERMAALGAMVAGISHELNTPIGNSLTVASTLVELSEEFQAQSENSITRKGLRDYTEATADAAAMLMRNLGKAAQLIGSFKQVAVDRTVAHRREFALDTVLQETLTTLIAVLRRKGHVIESDLEAGIVMDSYPGQLGQALTNIVQNADLHGLEGRSDGRIRVQSRALSADEAEIRISDNGKGIAPEHIRRIFDPFFTTKMGRGGSGLGLNIVHNLVRDVLGGHVDVDSIPGTGTSFVITLPRRAPSAPQAQVPDTPAD